jgi:SAM-dependent methyltransferase
MTPPSAVCPAPPPGSSEEPQFKVASQALLKLAAPTLPLSFLWEFLLDGRTPARAVSDAAMKALVPALHGAKPIIELGAGGDYYKRFVPSDQPYLTSNLASGSDLELDMTKLKLGTGSVDALVSVFALEHVYDFNAVFAEQERVLKPGGRLLLIVPFLYYYHAAPDDFFRFSASALDKLLAPFDILVKQPLGNRWLLFAEFLHEKRVMGSRMGFFSRLALRCVALPFLAAGLKSHDPRYAFGFAYLCEKKKK